MNWIAAKKKRQVIVKNKFPLFIRYFGCEAVKGSIKFYDDIYSDDKVLREKYFAGN
jgi:murein L,D-transpeptidase YcbB/YkuD